MARTRTSFTKGKRKTGGRKRGTPNKVQPEVRDFYLSVFRDLTYQNKLRQCIYAGKSPKAELYGLQLLGGKPTETVNVHGLSALTDILRRVKSGRRGAQPPATTRSYD